MAWSKVIRGLHDFRLKPKVPGPASEITAAAVRTTWLPTILQPSTTSRRCTRQEINGTGQKAGHSGTNRDQYSEIHTFRATYGLPANDPQPMLVPNSRNPGVSPTDLPEADLDL